MTTHEPHTDVFYTPRGLTAYWTDADLDIYNRLVDMAECGRERLQATFDAERADRFSYGPSLTTMVDYVTADVHKQTVEQALAVRA